MPDLLTGEEVQYRIEDLKKYGKEIPDGRRKQYFQNLDLLISEIRRGRDPGAARPLEKEVQAVSDRQRRGSKGAERGAGKGQIKDEDIEISDTEKVKFSPKFKKPGQLELPIFSQQQLEKPTKKPATKPKGKVVRKAKSKAVKTDQGLQGRTQKIRMATTGWIGSAGRVVRNVDEAASLASFIRKGAQELIYTIATAKNGLVHEIHKYSKGLKSSAPISCGKVEAQIFRIDGASCAHYTRTRVHYVCAHYRPV